MPSPSVTKSVRWSVPTDISRLSLVVQNIFSRLQDWAIALSEAEAHDIRLALFEAVSNAMLRGNQLDPDKLVEFSLSWDGAYLEIMISDEGEGFDVSAFEAQLPNDHLERPNGRGLFLIHRSMDHVGWNDDGNAIIMAKHLSLT